LKSATNHTATRQTAQKHQQMFLEKTII